MDRNEIYEKCFEIFIEHFNLEKEIKVLNEFEEKKCIKNNFQMITKIKTVEIQRLISIWCPRRDSNP